MESTVQTETNLFDQMLPSLEEIRQLANNIHSSEITMLNFIEQVEANLNNALAAGIGFCIIGRNEQVCEKLKKARDCKEKFIYLAIAQRRMGDFDEVVASFDASLKFDADKAMIACEKAATFRYALDFKSAEKELKNCPNAKTNAEYHYQVARLLEAQGQYDEAMDSYDAALEISNHHSRALFHIAYACDLRGDEEAAIDYYKQITSNSPVYVSALLNLAVVYEDNGSWEKANKCVYTVLQAHPNHQRAILFSKDIESSMTMYYDEEKEKRQDIRNQILETPISDFELSVRSRKCLKRMHIHTLGDLLDISEAELLSYKNFGETSLAEIKSILVPRGLRLGMSAEEKNATAMNRPVAAVSVEDKDLLLKSVDDLNLSVRAHKCLTSLGIHVIEDLLRKTEAELLGCNNFGVTSLNEIKDVLSGLGLSLRVLD